MRQKYRYLYFDLDRTLWDYENNAAGALWILYNKYALQNFFKEFDIFKNLFSRFNDFLWEEYREGRVHKDILRVLRFEMCFKEVGELQPELSCTLNNEFLDISPKSERLMPGTIELLDYLKGKKYKLFIITNGFTQIQEVKMKYSGLDAYVEKMFTSENVGAHKPNRDMFEYCIKSVNAKNTESLMIGDDLKIDIIGARNFGIDQVYYNPEGLLHSEKVTYEVGHLLELKKIL
jgi:putative hydrolase of the HAD superfamily